MQKFDKNIYNNYIFIIFIFFFLAKKQLPETRTDAVDQAILNLVEKRNSTDTMNSDDLFYLSISRDSQQLNVNAKLRLKALVLQALSQVVTEEQNKI